MMSNFLMSLGDGPRPTVADTGAACKLITRIKGTNLMLQMLKTYIDRAHWRDEGATAVEYGIMVALIAVVIIVAVIALGENIRDVFQETADCVADPGADCPSPTP